MARFSDRAVERIRKTVLREEHRPPRYAYRGRARSYPPTSAAAQMVLAVATQYVGGAAPYVIAKRLIASPANNGAFGWVKDTVDTADYYVRMFPGGAAIYPGMRLGLMYSHVATIGSTERRIYVPMFGDCFGFQASITAGPSGGTGGEKYYEWTSMSNMLHASEMLASGDTREGFTYPPALLIQSTYRDTENLLTFRSLGALHVWMTPASTPEYSEGFIFSGPHNPLATSECVEE